MYWLLEGNWRREEEWGIRILEKAAEENMELIFLMCKDKDTKDQRKDRMPEKKLWSFSVVLNSRPKMKHLQSQLEQCFALQKHVQLSAVHIFN